MADIKIPRKPRGYRFDDETVRIIEELAQAMSDPETGAARSKTEVIRIAVRELAKRKLSGSKG